jgi:hypothetical protein
MGVVALAGQHLCHVPSLLSLPHLGLQEDPKADVPTIGCKLPPAEDRVSPMTPAAPSCCAQEWGGHCPHLSTQPGTRISLSTCWEEPRPTVTVCSYCIRTCLHRWQLLGTSPP